MHHRIRETIYRLVITVLAFASLAFLVGITFVLVKEAAPFIAQHNILKSIFGTYWYPTYDPPEFGLMPLITGSLWVTACAALFCIPLGVGSALYLHELASYTQKAFLKPFIEILASIPSIVYGFFGMVVVAPFLQKFFHLPVGLCAFTGSIMLGIMAVPTVCSIAEDALAAVPRSFREASFALGATRWETLIQVIVPAAGSGISTAVILGMSRAIGETMTVLMVTGGAAIIPHSLFQPIRPMTATIAAEMGEVALGAAHYHALFFIGLILFISTLCFNVIAELISRRFRLKLGLGQ